jgi:hypothetical protein
VGSIEFFVKVADFAKEGFVLDIILGENGFQADFELSVVLEMLLFLFFDLFEDSLNCIPYM